MYVNGRILLRAFLPNRSRRRPRPRFPCGTLARPGARLPSFAGLFSVHPALTGNGHGSRTKDDDEDENRAARLGSSSDWRLTCKRRQRLPPQSSSSSSSPSISLRDFGKPDARLASFAGIFPTHPALTGNGHGSRTKDDDEDENRAARLGSSSDWRLTCKRRQRLPPQSSSSSSSPSISLRDFGKTGCAACFVRGYFPNAPCFDRQQSWIANEGRRRGRERLGRVCPHDAISGLT